MSSHDLDRLAHRVHQRRAELGLGVVPAARTAQISKDTWKRVEAGLPVRDTTYAKIERALQWASGSCEELLRGGEPVVVEPSEAAEGVVTVRIPPEELQEQVGEAVLRAAVAVTNLSAPEIRKLNEQILKDLRKRGLI